ncbi:MAG TPA: hypothetical protein P5136_00195 [Methanofastidiosum sp.]|nr:hypothetical protein [Methanofastidiosum sp.]
MAYIIEDFDGKQIECKTHGVIGDINHDLRKSVFIGDLEIPIDEFCNLIEYVLTNTDLVDMNDPRLLLTNWIKKTQIIEGYNSGALRLGVPQ